MFNCRDAETIWMEAVNKRVFLLTVVTDLRVSILVCELMGKLEVIVSENRPLQIREPSRKKITLTPFFCNLIIVLFW